MVGFRQNRKLDEILISTNLTLIIPIQTFRQSTSIITNPLKSTFYKSITYKIHKINCLSKLFIQMSISRTVNQSVYSRLLYQVHILVGNFSERQAFPLPLGFVLSTHECF